MVTKKEIRDKYNELQNTKHDLKNMIYSYPCDVNCKDCSLNDVCRGWY